jgi:hypothetical protein
LKSFFTASLLMKIVTLLLLGYTFYLNIQQTQYLRQEVKVATIPEITSQLNTNILCSYTFTLFIGLLLIFVIKNIVF